MADNTKATNNVTTTTVKPTDDKIKVKALVYLKYNTQRYAMGQEFEISKKDSGMVTRKLVSIVK